MVSLILRGAFIPFWKIELEGHNKVRLFAFCRARIIGDPQKNLEKNLRENFGKKLRRPIKRLEIGLSSLLEVTTP
jgi:hypothetical protein